MKTKILILIIFSLILVMFFSSIDAAPSDDFIITELGEYEITPNGKYVYINNSKAFIMAPAEMYGSGWTYLNFTVKPEAIVGDTIDIDLAVGFDTTYLKPKKAQLFYPHLVYTERTQMIYNVTDYYVHDGTEELDVGEYNVRNTKCFVVEYSQPNYNYSECDPMMFENCTPENYTTETLMTAFDSTSLVPSEFEVGGNYSITWYIERLETWRDITDKFSVLPESLHNNYDGKNKWYYVKDQPVIAGTEYQIRIFVDTVMQFGSHVYKYDVVVKPSVHTFQEAVDSGTLYVLDPLWNVSYNIRLKMPVNNTAGAGQLSDFQINTNLSAYSANASSLRCYNRTTGSIIAHWNESVVGGNVHGLWTNNSVIASGWDNNTFCAWQTTPTASSSSDGDATFIFFDDFSGDLSKWTTVAGTPSISSERLLLNSQNEQIRTNNLYTYPIIADFKWESPTTVRSTFGFGDLDVHGDGVDIADIEPWAAGDFYTRTKKDGSNTEVKRQDSYSHTTQISRISLISSSSVKFDWEGFGQTATHNTNIPDETMYFLCTNSEPGASNIYLYYLRLRKYNTAPPVYESPELEHYIPSLYHNTTPVTNIIYSNPHEYALNLTPTGKTNTNWTANSTGITDLVFTTDVTPGGYTNFTISDDNLDNITTWNLTASTEYDLKNSSGIVESQTTNADGNATFEVDLVAGDYWVEGSSVVSEYTPPDPITLANTTGNFWVNYTWDAGAGNVTDSYNVSQNGTWVNGSLTNFNNSSVGAHGYSDIIVYAWNSSGTGTLSTGNVTDNVTIPNNAIVISDVAATYTINEGETLSIDANYTDADGDTGTFNDNSSEWNVNGATGVVSWVTVDGDDGTYPVYINVTDGYGSTSTQEFSVTVNNSIFPPTVTLLSMTPGTICQNCTGNVNIVYGVTTDSSGLNNPSVSFIYRNYDPDCNCSNHSIRPPTNDLSAVWNLDGRILRAANRNETLNFENNDTITGGDIFSWSGLDENNTRLSIEVVNSTYFRIYINGTIHDVMPQAWYIDRSEMQEAPKTQLAIHKTQSVLVKFWNFEIFKGNTDFLGVGYTDTYLNPNPALQPSDANPVSVYYVPDTYDPSAGIDPITTGDAVYMLSLNGSEWMDHVYSPHVNSSYVRGFIDNNLLELLTNVTNISYLYYTSNTPTAKSFYINVTDVATSSNVSFADTNTLWTGDGTLIQQPYTPNIWFSFMKDNITFDHMLYVADNNNNWDNSTLNSTVVGVGLFPPTKPSFYAFHNGYTDTNMNGTYSGTFIIQIGKGSDPDGGDVVHNVSLHYGNETLIKSIFNTTCNATCLFMNVSFDSTPYSTLEKYTLKVVATDDEGETATVWLGVNFTINYDNFTFTNSGISPLAIREDEPFTVSVDITDIDGNIANAVVKINSNNYTMVNTAGDTWAYTFTGTSLPTRYEIDNFYAQDDFGAWNSTTSALYIDAVSSSGTGSGGGITPVVTPTITPTPTPTVPEVEEIKPAANISEIIERLIFGDKITILRLNLKTNDRLYLKEILIPNMTDCTYTSEIVNYCNVQDEIISLTIKFNPDTAGLIYTHKDYVNLHDDTYLYHTEFDVYIINLMASIDVPHSNLHNPSALLFSSSVGDDIKGVRIWWPLALIIIGIIYLWRKKHE